MIIPFIKPKEEEHKCSFCNTLEKNVKKMFSNGQGKFICNACVHRCIDRMKDDTP